MRRYAVAIIAGTSITLLGGVGSASDAEPTIHSGDPSHATYVCNSMIPEMPRPFAQGERVRIIEQTENWSSAYSADHPDKPPAWAQNICLEFGTW
ncbi:MAG: hypothetical protein ACJ72N_08020 [Labedaea sp.]